MRARTLAPKLTRVRIRVLTWMLDIAYLCIRVSTRIWTRVSFGANVRARMARSSPFGHTCLADASHDWQVQTSPICYIAKA